MNELPLSDDEPAKWLAKLGLAQEQLRLWAVNEQEPRGLGAGGYRHACHHTTQDSPNSPSLHWGSPSSHRVKRLTFNFVEGALQRTKAVIEGIPLEYADRVVGVFVCHGMRSSRGELLQYDTRRATFCTHP